MNLAVLRRVALVLVLVGFSAAGVAAQSLSRADGSTEARPSPPGQQAAQLPAFSGGETSKKLSRSDGSRTPANAGVRRFSARGGDEVTITHSASQNIVSPTGVACPTGPNSYFRVFNLSEFDLVGSFEVTSVDLGIEEVETAGTTTVNLHTLDGAFVRANLTQVGTASLDISGANNLSVVNVPVSGSFDADDVMVVEWAVPQTPVYFGGNEEGQTGPTYLRAEACGATEPTDLAELDFAESHWVLNVNGTVSGGGMNDEVESNNTPAQAQVLSPPFPVTINGNVEVSDQGTLTLEVPVQGGGTVEYDVEDLFRATTTAPGITLSLSGLSADVDLALFDEGGALIAASQAGGTSSESISRPSLAPGTYLIGVAIFDPDPLAPSSSYILRVEAAGGGDPPPPAPAGLTATAGDGQVTLSWSAVSAPNPVTYHVYRATAPFTAPGGATRLTSSPQTGTAYTDAAVTNGTRYYYRVSAVTNGTNEGPLSNQADAVPMNPRPPTVSASVNLVFGNAEQQQSYRLVALPGEVDVNLASTLTGSTPDDWRAFREGGTSGSEPFSHTECGNAGCRFAPGRGFWLLAENPWAVSEAFTTVDLASGGTYAIPVHRGWNAISNPLEVDVPWQSVRDANSLSPSLALYRWDGAWGETGTFASARIGTAYYFLNVAEPPLTSLVIPFPANAQPAPPVTATRSEGGFELTLSGRIGGEEVTVAVVSAAPDAAVGLDDYDRFAPPGYFEAAGLALVNDSLQTAYRLLRHDARPTGAEGYQYEVVLTGRPGTEVEIVPDLASDEGAFEAVLVDPASSVRYELRHGQAVQLHLVSPSRRYTLLVGSPAFVGAGDALPREHMVESYPNPFAGLTTIRYGLPEAEPVRLAVYNVLGERVALLLNGEAQEPGYHTAVWEPQNLASGVYFYVLETSATRLTGKMTVVK